MTNDDTASNHDYSGGLSDEIYRLVKRLRGRYRGTFVFNQLGEHLLFADAFTRLAEPHLPQPLKQDARLIRSRIDFELSVTADFGRSWTTFAGKSGCTQPATDSPPASPAPWRCPARHPTLPQMPARQTRPPTPVHDALRNLPFSHRGGRRGRGLRVHRPAQHEEASSPLATPGPQRPSTTPSTG